MRDDKGLGRCAADASPGHSAEPEPASAVSSADAASTPNAEWPRGPWRWFGSTYSDGQFYLATDHSGRKFVMGFRRCGAQGAQPTFQVDGRMVPAKELVKYDVGDGTARGHTAAKVDQSVYRYDFSEIDHPVARLFTAAPDLHAVAADALEFAVMFLAFVGRDQGTDRLDRTLDDLSEIAVRLDETARAALASAAGGRSPETAQQAQPGGRQSGDGEASATPNPSPVQS